MPAKSYTVFCIFGKRGIYNFYPYHQLWYINSKKIFKGQKNKVPKTAGRWYTAFLPGFTGTNLSCPFTMQKKNRNILSLSDCNVTPEYPYNTIKGYEGSIVMILVTLGCIPYYRTGKLCLGYHAIFLCYLFRIGWVNRMHQYFSLYNLFLLSKNLNFSKKSCIPSSYFISSFVSCRLTPPEWVL